MCDNNAQELYRTLAAPYQAEFVVQRSRFLACAAPALTEPDARACIDRLALEHPKARHCCWAYKTGFPDHPRDYFSDAGEPSGTAGAPIMAAINHAGLQNCVVVVVRYFGGIKLGVRGLIDAYRSAAQSALSGADIVCRQPMVSLAVHCSYPAFEQLKHHIERLNGSIQNPVFTDSVACLLLIPRCHESDVLSFCSAANIRIS